MAKPFIELAYSRRSIRQYLDKKVEREKIVQCVEAARLAPSAENVQPWRFIIIDDEELKHKFCKQAFSGIYSLTKWAQHAPVIIVILAKLDILANRIGKQIQGTNYYLIDVGITGEHLVLQAEELGLGTCWIGWFSAEKTRKFFKLPRSYKVVSLISMGYPASRPQKEKKRRTLEEIMWFNEIKKTD